MKKVQCIIKHQKLEAVKQALFSIGIKGMTVHEVSGCGNQKGFVQKYRVAESLVNLLPKLEIELVVPDELVEDIIATVMVAAKTGEQGDGKIFVIDVVEAVRIRTGERKEKAL